MNRYRVSVLLLALSIGGIGASTARAQARFDAAVAAEVMSGSAAMQAAGIMRDDQRVFLGYLDVALQQELAQEAVRRGLTERLDVQNAQQNARRQILIQSLRDDLARSLPVATEAEMKAVFQADTNRWTFQAGFQIDAVQLDAKDTNLMAKARAVVTGKPVPDADLAPFTNYPALATQGSGRWFTTNDFLPEVYAELPKMQQGEVRLFEMQAGPILIRRGAGRQQRPMTFDEARAQIQIDLQAQRLQKAWDDYIARKRKELGFQN
jgi:hypothetical protein